MSNLDQLRHAVDLLQQAYDQAYADMSDQYQDPLRIITAEGRYILLDALAALVNAQTVLTQADPLGPVIAYIGRNPKAGEEFAYMPEEIVLVREAKD